MDKRRYSLTKPPRVYEVAIATGMTSNDVRACLYTMEGLSLRSASHKVPLPIAIKFLYWIRNR
jgi:hypothetical protein